MMPTATENALVAAMNKAPITDNLVRNGIMAIAAHEGGFGAMKPELGYSNTSNARIRQIFGSRVAGLSEAQLNQLKASDRTFFNFVYDGANSIGKQLGNRPGTDDGYNFRGRGPIQFTGRANYERYSRLAGCPQVMSNVDLVDDLEIGSEMTCAYIKDRYKGNGFDGLMTAVGGGAAGMAERKRATFAQYIANHTFDWDPGAGPVPPPEPPQASRPTLRLGARGAAVTELQDLLQVPWLVSDGSFGATTDAVVKAFQIAKRLTVDGIVGPATWAALSETST